MTTQTFAPQGSGPCAKQTVKATVIAINGERFVGTNHCMNPQKECARTGMPSGVGYELCKAVCEQDAHAEVNAIRFAGDQAKGATLFLEGHTYACAPCMDAAEAAGVAKVIIGEPPAEYATNSAEQIAIFKRKIAQLEEASAKGFKANAKALLLVTQMRSIVDQLADLADKEFWE